MLHFCCIERFQIVIIGDIEIGAETIDSILSLLKNWWKTFKLPNPIKLQFWIPGSSQMMSRVAVRMYGPHTFTARLNFLMHKGPASGSYFPFGYLDGFTPLNARQSRSKAYLIFNIVQETLVKYLSFQISFSNCSYMWVFWITKVEGMFVNSTFAFDSIVKWRPELVSGFV